MSKEQKIILARIFTSGILLAILAFVNLSGLAKFAAYFCAYVIVGYDVIFEAFEGIRNREIFDECFLMTLATIGAFVLAVKFGGEYSEAVAVMLLYQIGEFFQDYAIEKSRDNIVALMDIRSDYANLESESGFQKVNPNDVKIGSVIIIKPGEKIPIDGKVLSGDSNIDTSALTGESQPRKISVGDDVVSGCVNLSGILRVKTSCEFANSTVSKILDLVENADSKKSKSERFVTRFAKIYTPVVCLAALAVAIIPPLISSQHDFGIWLYRALTFLVISCPCALVISVPLSFFAGIGAASREGILIKGANFLETLSRLKCMIFDKTGTLTRGVFEVTAIHPEILNENELLHLAAHVERYSLHPVANSLRKAYPNESDSCEVEDFEEISGYGVRAKVNGRIICAGNAKFMQELRVDFHDCKICKISGEKHNSGSVIHVAIDGKYAGHVIISDVLKPNSHAAIQDLRTNGISRIVILTGDSKIAASEVANELEIHEYYAELLPAEKFAKLETLMNANPDLKAGFAGDGINDAPVLRRADVGIAMGAMGSDAAIEAADVVIMDDDPLKISRAVKISRRVMRIVMQNIYFSLGVKILCLIASALGFSGMWLAIFADVGVMVLAVINAIRILL